MVFGFQGQPRTGARQQASAPLRRFANALGRSLALAAGTSLLCFAGKATAVETVVLQYGGQEQTISTTPLSDFVSSGTAPAELSDFLQNLGDLSELLPDILGTEIRISPDFIQSTLDTSLGEFVLIQLDQAMNAGSPEANIASLRGTVEAAAGDDGAISLLELIEKYPADTLNVDLNGLQLAYVRVSNFIERVEPALRVAKEFLQNLICDCENAPAAGAEAAPTSNAPTDAAPGMADPQSALPTGGRAACARAELLSVVAQLKALETGNR